jgi:hypothetical protein
MPDIHDENIYEQAKLRARQAWLVGLNGDMHRAQELLLRTRTEVKRLSGDLPLLGHFEGGDSGKSASLVTRTYAEAEAWGWLEMASGLYQLLRDRPGASLVHFKRAWRIWRPWSTLASDEARQLNAARERVRAALWLSACWSRMTSERAARATEAIWRAALSEIARLDASDLLVETTRQQAQFPPVSGTGERS